MFGNFSEEAQNILVKAKLEMLELKHPYIGTEHLVLSMLNHSEKIKEKLSSYHLDYEIFKKEIIKVLGIGEKDDSLFLYTPLLKKVINSAILDSKDNNDGLVTTEHLFSSLLEEGEGVAIRIFLSMGIDINAMYEEFATSLIKKAKPKKNRKFGLMGAFGIFIYVLVVTLYAYRSGEEIIKEKNSMPVEVADISLRNGELSDGLAAFTPLKEWKTDTVVGSEKEGMARIFHSDKCFNIFQTTVSIKCDNKIDYYQMLSECCRNQIPDSIALHEVLKRDSVIGGNKLYINSYKLQTDDFNGYWTFSALLDHSSYKIATLSCSEPDTLNASIKYVTQFMESVRFELNK